MLYPGNDVALSLRCISSDMSSSSFHGTLSYIVVLMKLICLERQLILVFLSTFDATKFSSVYISIALDSTRSPTPDMTAIPRLAPSRLMKPGTLDRVAKLICIITQ